MDKEKSLNRLTGILTEAKRQRASDVHLIPGKRIMFRVEQQLIPMSEECVESFWIKDLLKEMQAEVETLEQKKEIKFACTIDEICRVRIEVFLQGGVWAMVLHLLPIEIPYLKELGIPVQVQRLIQRKRGLILVAGNAGSGKTTTMASMLLEIAKNRKAAITTIECPIEYHYPQTESLIVQREAGSDSLTCADAIRATAHQDSDIVMIGELDGAETISAALEAAEAGKLVLASVNTTGTAMAIERLVTACSTESRHQMCQRMAAVLEGVITQQLLQGKGEHRCVAAFEVLTVTESVRALIREDKIYQLSTVLKAGRKNEMQAMDDAVYDLYMKSAITAETAVECSSNPAEMRQKVQIF